jgi:hypothetical protein
MKRTFRIFTFALTAAVFGFVGFKMLSPTQAVALASMFHDHEAWGATRIDALPPELRLEHSCGARLSAEKLLALQLSPSGTRFIALHFDGFRCENRNVLCWGSECLHEVYVRSGSSFRLALSIHAVNLKITKEGDMASLEVTTAVPHPSTVFYRWDGRRFVKNNPPVPNPR